MQKTEPRIYVASLSDYNNGILHGAWIDARQDAEEIQAAVKKILETSNTPGAEEWAIHDSEGFCGISIAEHESFETVHTIAEFLAKHGDVFVIAYKLASSLERAKELVEHGYRGHYESKADFGEQLCEDIGLFPSASKDVSRDTLQTLRTYFDFERFVDDMEMNGDITIVEDGYCSIHVFDNNV